MRIFVIVRKEANYVKEIAGPCIEEDLIFNDGCEVMDEHLFKTLYPEEYRRHILDNLIEATATWIESFYDECKQMTVEKGAIFTEHYICQPTLSEVHMMIRNSCDPSEAAALVLHLKRYVPEEIPITITALPASHGSLCGN